MNKYFELNITSESADGDRVYAAHVQGDIDLIAYALRNVSLSEGATYEFTLSQIELLGPDGPVVVVPVNLTSDADTGLLVLRRHIAKVRKAQLAGFFAPPLDSFAG